MTARGQYMPFGRHRGRLVTDLPDDYLAWLGTIELREPLASAVLAETTRRGWTPAVPAPVVDAAREIVAAGFRAAAMRHHPDHGGTDDAMRYTTEARDWLASVVTGAGA